MEFKFAEDDVTKLYEEEKKKERAEKIKLKKEAELKLQ